MHYTNLIATATQAAEMTASDQAIGIAGLAGLIIIAGFIFAAIITYCLPGVIASKRKHPNALLIWILTIFLGWSFFGWVGPLVWSIMPIERK